MPPTDPRYLASTREQILTEFWAYHYDDMKRDGKDIIEAEDQGFDLDTELRRIEAEADAAMDDDDAWNTEIDEQG